MPTNLNDHYLTIETLKKKEGFEKLTDEEAQMICDFTKTYAKILFDSYLERNPQTHESSNKRIPKVRKG